MVTGLFPVRSPLLRESRLISIPLVSFSALCIQTEMTTEVVGFPHSEIPGSKLVCQLPEAYRRLPRPSSPPTA
jgi:hypothetical protein